jgi:hypothetical protein
VNKENDYPIIGRGAAEAGAGDCGRYPTMGQIITTEAKNGAA